MVSLKIKKRDNQVVDASLRQTVLRSLYTVISTLLPVIALILFGSVAIINFDIALFVGLVAVHIHQFLWLVDMVNDGTKNLKQGIKKKKWFDNLGDELDELTVKGINK